MSELKWCPFCGSNELTLTIFDRYGSHIGPYKNGEKLFAGEQMRVVCEICDAFGPIADKAAGAVKLWNKR